MQNQKPTADFRRLMMKCQKIVNYYSQFPNSTLKLFSDSYSVKVIRLAINLTTDGNNLM